MSFLNSIYSLINTYTARYIVPQDFQEHISTQNTRHLRTILRATFVFGAIMLALTIYNYTDVTLRFIMMTVYFGGFATVSLLGLILLRITARPGVSYKRRLIPLYFSITFILALCIYLSFIPGTSTVNSILFFSSAALMMVIYLDINPLAFAIYIVSLFAAIFLIGHQTRLQYNTSNLALFSVLIVLLGFFKRHMTLCDLRQKKLLKTQNETLEEQKEELERQKTALLHHRTILESEVAAQTAEIKEKNEKIILIQKNTIIGLSNLVENRDEDTGEHVRRTSAYVELLARKALENNYFADVLNSYYIELLAKAAPMHDIGKIVVPDSVLKKPGRLDSEEFEQMKRHASEGGRIVREVIGNTEDADYIQIASDIATHHHERWNGEGYPDNLKAEAIPLSARIMSIADVFDALVSPRCYKDPIPIDKALDIIIDGAGSYFDPILAQLFNQYSQQVSSIADHYR